MKFYHGPLLVSISVLCAPVHARPTGLTTIQFTGENPSADGHGIPQYCAGTNYNETLTETYICGDARLGPASLPTSPRPLAALLRLYDRFGGLWPGAYLHAWLNATTGWWNYPPSDGFVLGPDEEPVAWRAELVEGTLVDRFGGEKGKFVSPVATPYMQRSLPPSSLDGAAVAGIETYYHVYRVIKPLLVTAGPVAPWFGQPGLGMQYVLQSSVGSLVRDGCLEWVDVFDLDDDEESHDDGEYGDAQE